jgi:hypothetical protein
MPEGHAEQRLVERYGPAIANRSRQRSGQFQITLRDLLRVIRAGNATETFSVGAQAHTRTFDVPITFEEGDTVRIRCLVQSDLSNVMTILPPESKRERRDRLRGERRKKELRAQKIAEQNEINPVTPDEEDEAVLQMSPPVPVRASTSLKDLLSAAYRTR